MKFKIIIFDVDGTLLNTAKLKNKIFKKIFFTSKHKKEIYNYHIKNLGVNRILKFKYISQKYYSGKLDIKLTEKKFKEIFFLLLKYYKVFPYVLKLLKKLKKKKIRIYISSGIEKKELIKILKIKKIFNFFKVIYGYPDTKNIAIKKIIKKNLNIKKKQILFIGDGITDYLAAKKNNIKFLAFYSNEFKSFWKKNNIKVIRGFKSFVEKNNNF